MVIRPGVPRLSNQVTTSGTSRWPAAVLCGGEPARPTGAHTARRRGFSGGGGRCERGGRATPIGPAVGCPRPPAGWVAAQVLASPRRGPPS